ncbi:hypothetical protein TNCV_3091661 [Trichonephila clavipes]|nr:hypothetical protein TNCV_3091661 [Trichonephila clavipes]
MVKSGEIHLIQTTHVPMLIYELPASSLKCRAQPNVIRRSFEPHDQMLYHRTILESHTAYPIPAGTNYIVLTLPPPTPIHVPAEKRPLEEKALPFSKKRSKARITPVMRRVSRRSQLPMAPVQIPQPTVQIPDVLEPPVQIPQTPVQIPDVLEPPVQIPFVHIPDVPEPVQIPVSQVPQPPMQILHVSEPVQIPVSQVPQSPVQIPPV